MTATAAPPVRAEIVERLDMRAPRVVVQGFNRPNIWLGVETFADEDVKRRALLERITEAEKPGIVYAATRKHADDITADLTRRGVKALHYHAGMKPTEREEAQEAFMRDEVEVIVATTAFGMGIDKPNVRFVFHHDISDSVDSYYQEIGRAGRDGAPARAILFYRPEDLSLRRFFAGGGMVDVAQVERVAIMVREHGTPVDPGELREESHLSQSKLGTALNRLEEVGVVRVLEDGEVAPGDSSLDVEDAASEVVEIEERHRAVARSRVGMVQGYAELDDCRRAYLLNYFGEDFAKPCNYCDKCDVGHVVVEDKAEEPFPLNARVRHTQWGEGLVVRYESDKMVVLFDEMGYRTLLTELAHDNHLLEPVEG